MNADDVARILAGADLEGGSAPGQLCTSCHVPMQATTGKRVYLYCPHCGCSPERGVMAGIACDCPPHPVEGVVCS